MKKLFAFMLAAVMLLSCASLAEAADEKAAAFDELVGLLSVSGDVNELNRVAREYADLAGTLEGEEQQQAFDFALKAYEAADYLGNAYAKIGAGVIYSNDVYAGRDYEKAFRKFSDAAELGDSIGAYNAGALIQKGQTDADLFECISWYEKALELEKAGSDETQADLYLGLIYLQGNLGTNNPAKGVEYLTASARKNNAEAWHWLGHAYNDGTGVQVDLSEAIRCYKHAEALGNTQVNGHLGTIYYNDEEHRDILKAAACFNEGAKNGNNYCIYMMGVMYELDQVVKPDAELAARCYAQAARLGESNAVNVCEARGVDYSDANAYPDVY